jgi:hypothetical protein
VHCFRKWDLDWNKLVKKCWLAFPGRLSPNNLCKSPKRFSLSRYTRSTMNIRIHGETPRRYATRCCEEWEDWYMHHRKCEETGRRTTNSEKEYCQRGKWFCENGQTENKFTVYISWVNADDQAKNPGNVLKTTQYLDNDSMECSETDHGNTDETKIRIHNSIPGLRINSPRAD